MTNDPPVARQLSSVPIFQRSNVSVAQAVAFHEALSPGFKEFAKSTVTNAKALSARFMRNGVSVITGGTDNHLVAIDLKPFRLTWETVNQALNSCFISADDHSLPIDTSCFHFGTSGLTSRGMTEPQMNGIADIIAEILLKLSLVREVPIQLEANARKFVFQLAFKFPVFHEIILPSPLEAKPPIQFTSQCPVNKS